MTSKAAQTCEDCISRQEAISAIQDEYYDNVIGIDIVDIIAHLSPVTPQPKIGQWIKVDDEEPIAYDCSECTAMVSRKYKYCPNCGSKMESEE